VYWEASRVWLGVDSAVLAIVPFLAAYFILSGLDDLAIDLLFLRLLIRQPPEPATPDRERALAILIPAWREEAIIGRMLDYNRSVIRYGNYEIFVGAYPNDPGTVDAIQQAMSKSGKIHLCLTPHPGPTSKADCLNWIYQHVRLWEEREGRKFEGIVLQDSEDLIHREALHVINRYLSEYDMIQIPVVPIATPWRLWTHGVYCDEFAELQFKDLRVRHTYGGFLPSCGVGTALSRRAVEALAERQQNRVFEPECLTEDYELGLRVHRAGLRQIFVPLRSNPTVATREFFPHTFRAAVRQRTRWITGIALQCWERNGWGRSWREVYWFWRDRKGLLGHFLSLLANGIFLWGLITAAAASYTGRPWAMSQAPAALVWSAMGLHLWRTGWRVASTARIYGWRFAALAPLRIFWANAINFTATLAALRCFVLAKVRGTPLVWLKTTHAFPSPAALRRASAAKGSR